MALPAAKRAEPGPSVRPPVPLLGGRTPHHSPRKRAKRRADPACKTAQNLDGTTPFARAEARECCEPELRFRDRVVCAGPIAEGGEQCPQPLPRRSRCRCRGCGRGLCRGLSTTARNSSSLEAK